jgi:DNA polymerase-3 subunit gamma/tau
MGEFIVTALKFRPSRFEDVVGQEHVTATLRNAMEMNRLAHAYIFSGARGVGKTTTARILAKVVNCAHPVNGDPDNECESCVEITAGRNFDVLEIDGASNRGVDEIRNLRESVRYAPSRGKKKVYIIDEVHMLTKEAFNALLKTLEEPPPHVLFIFATTELHRLPATILSRCQRFEFRRIPIDKIKANLAGIATAEGISMDDKSLQLIAKKGDGSLRDAQSTFDMVVSTCGTNVTYDAILEALNAVNQEIYFQLTDLLRVKDTSGILALVQDVMNHGYDLREFIGGVAEHFRNLMLVKATGSSAMIEASDVDRRKYEEVSNSFSLPDLMRCQRLINGTEASLRWVSQPRFRLEADLVLMAQLPTASDIGDLLRELEELKKKTDEPRPLAPPRSAGAPAASDSRSVQSPPPVYRKLTPIVRNKTEAPPAPEAPRAAAINPQEVSSRWQEFLDTVRLRHVSLVGTVEGSTLSGVEGNIIHVRCQDPFHVERLNRVREKLSDVLLEIFGVRLKIEPSLDNDAVRPEAPETPADEPEHPIMSVLRSELGARPLQ